MSAAPHVVIVGLPGAGKSSVARAVADRLGVESVDLDEQIERLAGAPIPAIFAASGEAEFRRLEAEATRELLERPSPGVIAAGGGWIANTRARELVPTAWAILYLRVSPPEALSRLGKAVSTRPLLAGGGTEGASGPGSETRERLERLAADRLPLYEQADFVVDTEGRALAEVADRVAAVVSPLLSSGPARARSTQ